MDYKLGWRDCQHIKWRWVREVTLIAIGVIIFLSTLYGVRLLQDQEIKNAELISRLYDKADVMVCSSYYDDLTKGTNQKVNSLN